MSGSVTVLLTEMLRNTYTMGDLYRRLGILRECVETSLYTESALPFVEVCKNFLSEQEETPDTQAVRDWGVAVFTAFTRENVHTQMTALHEALESLPLLTLYVPVELSDTDIVSIGQWCRDNVDTTVLLDIHIDPQAVGGCTFVWNDKHYDLSFHGLLKDHKGVITSVVSSYDKK